MDYPWYLFTAYMYVTQTLKSVRYFSLKKQRHTPLKQKNIPTSREKLRRHKERLCINCCFIFLSYPRPVVGYPEVTEKTGFPPNRPRE